MRKVLVVFAMMLSMTVTADAGSLDYKARVTAYTVDGEKADEVVADCPNFRGSLEFCQIQVTVPFEGTPWNMWVRINERVQGIVTVELSGQERPAGSWEKPTGGDRMAKKSGESVEIDARWIDRRLPGKWQDQTVTVARLKIDIL